MNRVSEIKRQYGTARWQRVRLGILNRDGWRCRKCGAASGKLEVHHIVRPIHGGAMFDPGNLLTVCQPCHFAAHYRFRQPDPDLKARMEYINRGA